MQSTSSKKARFRVSDLTKAIDDRAEEIRTKYSRQSHFTIAQLIMQDEETRFLRKELAKLQSSQAAHDSECETRQLPPTIRAPPSSSPSLPGSVSSLPNQRPPPSFYNPDRNKERSSESRINSLAHIDNPHPSRHDLGMTRDPEPTKVIDRGKAPASDRVVQKERIFQDHKKDSWPSASKSQGKSDPSRSRPGYDRSAVVRRDDAVQPSDRYEQEADAFSSTALMSPRDFARSSTHSRSDPKAASQALVHRPRVSSKQTDFNDLVKSNINQDSEAGPSTRKTTKTTTKTVRRQGAVDGDDSDVEEYSTSETTITTTTTEEGTQERPRKADGVVVVGVPVPHPYYYGPWAYGRWRRYGPRWGPYGYY